MEGKGAERIGEDRIGEDWMLRLARPSDLKKEWRGAERIGEERKGVDRSGEDVTLGPTK